MAFVAPLTQAQAVARVRVRVNEKSQPGTNNNLPDPDIVTDLLNEGSQQVVMELGPVTTTASLPILALAATAPLPADLLEIDFAAYSLGSSLQTVGVITYPLQYITLPEFIDYCGGQPTTGLGIPKFYTTLSDTGGVMTIQIWAPPFQDGFILLKYTQRPQVWASATPGGTINVDQSWQELIVRWACAMACYSLDMDEKGDRFMKLYESLMAICKGRLQRRKNKGPSQIRDVYWNSLSGVAWWLR
jgi:hypothetical protein